MVRWDRQSVTFTHLREGIISYTSMTHLVVIYKKECIKINIFDWTNKIRLGGVSEYYNKTRGMVISGILEYRMPREALDNYTVGSGIEVNSVK